MYRYKGVFFAMLLLLLSVWGRLYAQAGDSLLTQLAQKWNNAKGYALDMAARMPDSAYHYRPTPEEMTFGEQLLHIAANINWLSNAYLFAAKPTTVENANTLSKAAIIGLVSAAYDTGYAAQQRLNATQLDDTVAFFAGDKTRRQILLLLHDHQTHHVGQLVVYLRLQGIKPPAYVGW